MTNKLESNQPLNPGNIIVRKKNILPMNQLSLIISININKLSYIVGKTFCKNEKFKIIKSGKKIPKEKKIQIGKNFQKWEKVSKVEKNFQRRKKYSNWKKIFKNGKKF